MNPNPLAHLAHRPLALLPSALDSFALRFAEPAALASQIEASRFVGTRTQGAPYRVQGDTAIVGVLNPLVTREGSGWGTSSYEFLGAAFDAAARDAKIKSILVDCDSPGGHVTGVTELASTIRRVNASKPVVASVNGLCASACYCVASAARTIVATPSSTLGSIGVVMVHGDISRALDKAGISPSLIFAGKKKTAGNMFEPLPKDVRADLQKEVDSFYAMLCDCVSLGRGHRLTAAKARATEAATFLGKDAVAAGLADTLGVFDDALVAARRAGVGATSYSVALPPKVGAALPSQNIKPTTAQPKPAPVTAANNFGWDEVVAAANARHARERGIRR